MTAWGLAELRMVIEELDLLDDMTMRGRALRRVVKGELVFGWAT